MHLVFDTKTVFSTWVRSEWFHCVSFGEAKAGWRKRKHRTNLCFVLKKIESHALCSVFKWHKFAPCLVQGISWGRWRDTETGFVISSPPLALWPNPNPDPLSISVLSPLTQSFSYALFFWQKRSFVCAQNSVEYELNARISSRHSLAVTSSVFTRQLQRKSDYSSTFLGLLRPSVRSLHTEDCSYFHFFLSQN